MSLTILDRELYSTSDAARLLGIPTSTLTWWLQGGRRGDRVYPPVLRDAPREDSIVTWAEFVEAKLLRGYRDAGAPLQGIRTFVEKLRVQSGVPYPLAHYRPLVDDKALVYDLQKDTGLDPRLYLVRPADGDQLQLAPPVLAFLKEVEFDEGIVARLRPFGEDSGLSLDPEIRFGQPQIRGIRAEVIAETADAESVAAAADAWELTEDEVSEAVRWQQRAA